MEMYLVGSCPKCKRNIYRFFSLYDGWHEECFNCGYRHLPGGPFREMVSASSAGPRPASESVALKS